MIDSTRIKQPKDISTEIRDYNWIQNTHNENGWFLQVQSTQNENKRFFTCRTSQTKMNDSTRIKQHKDI